MLLWLGLAWAAETDRVFLVVVDGLRDEEGVLAGEAQLPVLWGRLRPLGALAPLMWNRDSTVTDASHRSLVTGRRQPITGLPWYEGRVLQRDWTPTLMEAGSLGRGGGGYVIGNTVFMDSQGRSLVPGYAGGAVVEATTTAVAEAGDRDMVQQLLRELTDEQRVVLLNIHEADKFGHAAQWDAYLDGLRTADELAGELVDHYGTERTTWFFLSDHGRHRDDDWAGHGDQCDGCRSSWLLALGAGVQAGVTLDVEPDLIDVAPTAAWLLGAPMPSARGRVLTELLRQPPALPAGDDALVEPSTSLDGSGTLHQVARRLPSLDGDGALVYRQRRAGAEWSAWTPFQTQATLAESPYVVAEGSTVWRACRAWDAARGLFSVSAERSVDAGATWERPALVSRAVQPYERPVLAASAGVTGAWWADARASGDAPASLHVYTEAEGAWSEETASLGDAVHVVTEPVPVRTAAGSFVLFAGIPAEHYDPNLDDTPADNPGNQDRDVWLFRGSTASPSLVRLTEDPGIQYWPALAADADGGLTAAWATRSGATLDAGAWSVVTTRSTDGGVTWSTPIAVPAAGEAWKPVLVAGATGTWLALQEHTGGATRVGVYAVEDGVATRRATAVESPGWIEDVHLVATDAGLFVGWAVGEDTLVHRVADVLLPWSSLAADAPPPDTGEAPDDCGCAGGGVGAALATAASLVAAGARRRRARGA